LVISSCLSVSGIRGGGCAVLKEMYKLIVDFVSNVYRIG
jgi:hypothetical protein